MIVLEFIGRRQHELIFGLFLIAAAIQYAYLFGVLIRIPLHKPLTGYHRKFPVSVLICARNEADNLAANLPLVLQQDYPDFEVIVVNDASTDHTADVLGGLQDQYPGLRTTLIKPCQHTRRGKKLALTIGIKAAANEWLLLTDADCRPAGRKWLSRMQRSFTADADVVLGYGGYKPGRGLLNYLIRYDTVSIAQQYLAYALAGLPYMGVGRNLAYRKSLFFRNKGFASHYHLDSGDDDLFVNEVARKNNTLIEIRKEAHTLSECETSWRNWYFQKKRHLQTGPRYRPLTRGLIVTELFGRYLLLLSFIWLVISKYLIAWVLSLFVFRMLAQLLIFKSTMHRLNEKYLLVFSPLLELVLPLLNAVMLCRNFIDHKRSRWK